MTERILNSWKEIAQYLGRGVRTVQRWEAELGLPVRRPRGHARSSVLALSSELDEWVNRTPVSNLHEEPVPLLQPTLPVVAVVDDDEIHRYTLAVTVARAGYSVVEADCGNAGIRLIQSIRPQVAVVDVRMPDMNGFEVCRKITEALPDGGTSVLLHTALEDTPAARTRAAEVGAKAFLGYPVSSERLLDCISRFAPRPVMAPSKKQAIES